MGKKKNKQIIRPWCWYCEREFEDEKVLMQHQKAKHFKCNMCPRRLNTAGGLAVHIQQVHKLEPENLPRIENALPGRDGYEVEIFGMEGIPAPDVADYKRRKEIELGLSAGSITQPQAKRPKVENRPLTEEQLRVQLEAHKALMGATEPSAVPAPADANASAVYGAPPQAYVAPPVPAAPMQLPLPVTPVATPGMMPPVPGLSGPPPSFFPGIVPGQPPILPFPGMPFPPVPPPPGFSLPPGFPPPPLGALPPGAPVPPFLPGMRPPIPLPPPTFVPASSSAAPPSSIPTSIPAAVPTPVPASPPASEVPNQTIDPIASAAAAASAHAQQTTPPIATPMPTPVPSTSLQMTHPTGPTLPNRDLFQTNPGFKKKTELKYIDANYSPDEKRAYHSKYYVAKNVPSAGESVPRADVIPAAEEMRGKKRARAEDFL